MADMLKADKERLEWMEKNYPGIKKQINHFEKAKLPRCSHCKSRRTADVQVGIIGRTIYIAGATTKFKLIPNGPSMYFIYSVNGSRKATALGTAYALSASW